MKKIVFATGNKGKLKEVKKIFNDYEIISLHELTDVPEIIEDASTFEGNAFIKAEIIFNKYQVPVIADDSGLCIDQLNGEPGVFSARYAGENCTYDDNNKKAIKELQKFNEPHLANFVCCAVYYDGTNKFSVEGKLQGEIIKTLTGTEGFGYDPIFKADGMDKTLAQITVEEKNTISHRGKAFNKLKSILEEKGL